MSNQTSAKRTKAENNSTKQTDVSKVQTDAPRLNSKRDFEQQREQRQEQRRLKTTSCST